MTAENNPNINKICVSCSNALDGNYSSITYIDSR